MSLDSMMKTYDRIVRYLNNDTDESQIEYVNILVECWLMTKDELGYIVGRLVGSNKIETESKVE